MKDDWAIVVGVEDYPALGDVPGAENDARAFYDWLRSPTGGDVPSSHISLIVTSQYKRPFRSPKLAKPTEEQVQKACLNLIERASKNSERGSGARVGRRLYLYMAGQGFEPVDGQPALLMANSDGRVRLGSGYHVLGPHTADWFYRAGYFDEIILFMDCCREVPDLRVSLNQPFAGQLAADGLEDRKRFFAYATKWSRASRAHLSKDGVIRGVFTQALLTGLQGAAAVGGKVTTDSLRNYLLNQSTWSTFLAPEDLEDPEVPKEPQVLALDHSFVLVDLPESAGGALRFPVSIHLPANAAGKQVQIQDGHFAVIESTVAQSPLWRVELPPGLYQVHILELGLQQGFEITSLEPADVWLDVSLDFANMIEEKTKDFTGREWLFAEVDRWLADPGGSRFFLITGEPGIGKTAFAARLSQIRPIAARHFCLSERTDTLDAGTFANSIARQLSAAVSGFAEALTSDTVAKIDVDIQVDKVEPGASVTGVEIKDLRLDAASPEVLFERAVIRPLQRLVPPGSPVVIIVDALDEAVATTGRPTIADLLATADLPPYVRFVVTSRPGPWELRWVAPDAISRLTIDPESPQNLSDVRALVRSRVAASGALQRQLDSAGWETEAFASRIVEAGSGNFARVLDLLGGAERGEEVLPPEQPAPPRIAAALVVGINNYPPDSGLQSLKLAVADANGIAGMLQSQFQVPAERIHLLVDRATKREMLAAMQRVASEVGEGQEGVIYFSGKSGHFQGTDEMSYESAIAASDSLAQDPDSLLTHRELLEAVSGCKGHIVLILDVCHDGSMVLTRHAPPGLTVLAASRDNEMAYEVPGAEHGVFTGALLDQFKVWKPGMTWGEVYLRVFGQVVDRKFEQHPMLIGDGRRVVFGGGAVGEWNPDLPVLSAHEQAVEVYASPALVIPLGQPSRSTTSRRTPIAMRADGSRLEFELQDAPSLTPQTAQPAISSLRLWRKGVAPVRLNRSFDMRSDSDLIAIAPSPQDAFDYHVERQRDRLVILDSSDQPLAEIPTGTPSVDGSAEVLSVLENVALCRHVRRLANDPAGGTPLSVTLAVQSLNTADGTVVAGQPFTLVAANRSATVAFISIWQVRSDLSIHQLHPARSDCDVLYPGAALTMQLSLDDSAYRAVTLKLVATAEPHDLRMFEQDANPYIVPSDKFTAA